MSSQNPHIIVLQLWPLPAAVILSSCGVFLKTVIVSANNTLKRPFQHVAACERSDFSSVQSRSEVKAKAQLREGGGCAIWVNKEGHLLLNDLYLSAFLITVACLARDRRALLADSLSLVNNMLSHLSLFTRVTLR